MAGRKVASIPSYKLVLLGESAVGKSSIVLRLVKQEFDEYRESTIGAAFLSQTVQLDDQRTIKFEIWDTAGQERYKSLAPMRVFLLSVAHASFTGSDRYYRSARAAIVAYDVTSEASLEKAKSWIKELQRQADPNILLCLAGNKADLVDQREVSTETAQKYAQEESALFFEVSAKSGQGISEMFVALATKLAAQDPPAARSSGVSLEQKPQEDGPCAC